MAEQTILDMCCGSRMFWFDKQDPRAVFTASCINNRNALTS